MSFLFDYQINYYSDSKNVTQLPFSVFALTQQGLEHKSINIGNQDSGSLYLGKKTIIGAVADGCTGGKNLNGKSANQVGAHIGSYLAVRIARKLLLKRHLPLNELLPSFEQELILNYKRLLNTINPWEFEKDSVIQNLFLTTIIFFVITEEMYLIANCGDGDVIINSIHKDLNDDSGKYFASNLRGIHKLENGKYMINPDKKFNIIEQGVTSSLDNIFIATDGFLDNDIREHIIFEKFFLNGIYENSYSGFKDRKTEFRREFLSPILEMKDSRIWPHDDATFISLKRVANK